jgi:Flp pilus assembly protein protease CpaA
LARERHERADPRARRLARAEADLTGPALALLLLALALCTISDLLTRNIPNSITVPLVAVAIAGGFWLWPFSIPAALLALAAFALAGLPGGDQKAIVTVGGLLGLGPTVLLLAVTLAVTLVAFATLGRRRSLIGVPFFPLVAAVTTLVLIAQ